MTYLLTVPPQTQPANGGGKRDLHCCRHGHQPLPRRVSAGFSRHPGPGHPFLGEHNYLLTNARAITSGANFPGNIVDNDAPGAPSKVLPEGPGNGSVALDDIGAKTTEAVFVSPAQGFRINSPLGHSGVPSHLAVDQGKFAGSLAGARASAFEAVKSPNAFPGEGFAPEGKQRGGPGSHCKAGSRRQDKYGRPEFLYPQPRTTPHHPQPDIQK